MLLMVLLWIFWLLMISAFSEGRVSISCLREAADSKKAVQFSCIVKNMGCRAGWEQLSCSLSMYAVSFITQSCLILCDPHGLQPTRLLCPWGFSRQAYWSGLPYPSPSWSMWTLNYGSLGIEPRPPALEAWSLSHWTTREVPSPRS